MRAPLAERLAVKSSTVGECIEWQGTRQSRGYGYVKSRGKTVYVHRAAWEIAKGAIPAGLYVLHSCDNPSCLKIEHLFLGTPLDNARDMIKKGRQLTGARHPRAKLSEIQVANIRSEYAKGGVFLRVLASKYAVNLSAIHKIIRSVNWKLTTSQTAKGGVK